MEAQSPTDSRYESDPYFTEDEDENSSNYGMPKPNASNHCYQRRGRKPSRASSSKSTTNGHTRAKSDTTGITSNVGHYGPPNITGNLTNVEILSNCQLPRRRVSSTTRDRDLSPSDMVRQYFTKEKEQIDHMIGTIVHKVGDVAEVAAQKSTAAVKNIVHNVHEKAEVAAQKSSEMVHSAIEKSTQIADQLWKVCHFEKLPAWQKDNEHLLFGHRPELSSAAECFKSIFRIHTETGNIWTHMIGFFAFLVVTIVFYVKPLCDNCHVEVLLSDKLIFLCFFIGAMLCLLCSTLFHTMTCHSQWVSNVFSRLDYAGIALLIVGSSITWLYYGFYCQFYHKLTYAIAIGVLGILTIILTLMDKFNSPDYRSFRASIFVALGLISAAPIVHLVMIYGVDHAIEKGALLHGLAMGALYIGGAVLYAARIPERLMPGKCDIWFQSHQIFHLLVVAAAFVFYHGVSGMANHRLVHEPICPTMQ